MNIGIVSKHSCFYLVRVNEQQEAGHKHLNIFLQILSIGLTIMYLQVASYELPML